MRYLIFNLVVAGALVYLVTGGNLSRIPSSDEAAQRVAKAAKVAMDHGHDISNKMISQIRRTNNKPRQDDNGEAVTDLAKTSPLIEPTPPMLRRKVVPTKAPGRNKGLNNQARTQSKSIDENGEKSITKIARTSPNLPPIKDPTVLRRRAEVLAEGSSKNAVDTPNFMSPRDRRRELRALSEEMELLFASTMAR